MFHCCYRCSIHYCTAECTIYNQLTTLTFVKLVHHAILTVHSQDVVADCSSIGLRATGRTDWKDDEPNPENQGQYNYVGNTL